MKTIDLRFLARFRLGRGPAISDRMAQVNIDNRAFELTAGNLWRRGMYGRAIEAVSFAGAKVVGVDIVFSGVTDSLQDLSLTNSIGRSKVVISPLVFRVGRGGEFGFEELREFIPFSEPSDYPDLPPDSKLIHCISGISAPPLRQLADNSLGMGYVNMFFDPDGVIRRYPLVMNIEGRAFPSFPLRLLCVYLEYPLSQVEISPGKNIALRNVLMPGTEERRDIEIPIDRRGYALLNYVGTWEDGFDNIYSAGDILKYTEKPGLLYPQLGERLILLTEFSDRTGDRGNIPLESNYPRSGVYTTILNSILTGEYLREADRVVIVPISLVFLAVIIALGRFTSMTGFTLGYFALVLVYIASCFAAFIYGSLIIPLVGPSSESLALFLGVAAAKFHYQEQHRLFLEGKFKCYLSPAILRKIQEDPSLVNTGGEKRNLIVFFADIRKFSRYSESLEARELVAFANRYYSLMVDVALKYDATVDKYTGDEIMIYFGAPYAHNDDHIRALKMTMEMGAKLDKFNKRIASEGYEPIRIGIGINYGPVVVGNIGSVKRMDYSVMGDVINKGARIVASAGPGEIKISESYYKLVEDFVEVEKMEPFTGKAGEALIQTYLLKAVVNL